MNRTAQTLDLLRRYESPNVLHIDPAGGWPIVWDRAQGMHVWDADGRKYLDLTAAFGVAATGHANARVVKAGQKQMRTLLHAMGDVHPHPLKAALAARLSEVTFERWTRPTAQRDGLNKSVRRGGSRLTGKTIFGNSGFEAVEAALKTALLATGKRGVIAFEGGYHGLGYGALNTTHRKEFRSPFRMQLGRFGRFVPFPTAKGPSVDRVAETIRRLVRRYEIGAILVEPVQGRGGIRIPPPDFLPMLRAMCDEARALLIIDEIYTGFGRAGRWFACEHTQTVPDLICLGKALTGGFPLSACVGKADVIDEAWPVSTGEAIHTSTFLGHPVGCAMALAQIAEIADRKLVEQSQRQGDVLLHKLEALQQVREDLILSVRGSGLMAGIEWRARKSRTAVSVSPCVRAMLRCGFILLPEGERGQVLAFTPPLIVSENQLGNAIDHLSDVLMDRAVTP